MPFSACAWRRAAPTRSVSTSRRSACPSSETLSTAFPTRLLRRQFLHATHLGFPHPFTGEMVEVDSPLPPELAAYWDSLG